MTHEQTTANIPRTFSVVGCQQWELDATEYTFCGCGADAHTDLTCGGISASVARKMRLLKKLWPYFWKRQTSIEEYSDKDEEDSEEQTLTHNGCKCKVKCILRRGRDEGNIRFVSEGENLVSDGIAASRPTEQTSSAMNPFTEEAEAVPPLFVAIQTGDIWATKMMLEETPELVNSTKYSGLLPIHAACYVKNLSALRELLKRSAKVEALSGMGYTALHLAVSEGWHVGVAELLQRGASPDTMSSPPSTVRGVQRETPLHAAVRRGDLASTNLLLQHQPDLTLKDDHNCSILHLAALARNLEIIRQLLKEKLCKEVLTGGDCDGNSVLHTALLQDCDMTEESTVQGIVEELVLSGADVNSVNKHGESPLFLASRQRLPKVVEFLLSKGADPAVVTRRGQSVLHAACQNGSSTCLSHLLNTNSVSHLVTTSDRDGRDPFHYAVHSGSIDCCELLLNNGDHLTRLDKDRVSRCSLILEHLPSATQLLRRLFDAHVRLSNRPQHDADFRVTFDYTVLHSEKEGIQSSLISELTASRLEALLKHPLLESFLFMKWRKIKPFFYCSVLIYLFFLIMHTTFIVMTFSGDPRRWQDESSSLALFLVLHVAMFLLILIPDLIIMFANFRKYLRQWETLTKTIALGSSAIVVFFFVSPLKDTEVAADDGTATSNATNDDTFQADFPGNGSTVGSSAGSFGEDGDDMEFVRNAAAVSAFFCWVEFMMLLGRFPSLGTYVLMFTRVAQSIIKFTAAFFSLIIGFAVSFMVLYHNEGVFNNLPLSLVKTLMMMIGEIEYGDLITMSKSSVMSCLFLVLFLFLVCVLMANLLIGLAVNDIPDLQRQGKIKRLSKQASYLVSYEKLMMIAHNLRCFPRQLRILLTSRCKIPQVVTFMPNKDSYSKMRKQHYLPSETLQEAILLGNCEDPKEDFGNIEEDDILTQFKSFKMKYVRDRRALNRRLAQLPDSSTTDKILRERFDQMQQMIQNQLVFIVQQMQQQQQSSSNGHHHYHQQQQQQLPPAQQYATPVGERNQQVGQQDQSRKSSLSYQQFTPHTHQQQLQAPQQSLPQQSVLQQSVQTQQWFHQSVQTQTVPQQFVQPIAMPQQSVETQTILQQSVQSQMIPQQSVQTEPVPQQSVQTETVPQHSVQTVTVSQQSVQTEAVPQQYVQPQSMPQHSNQHSIALQPVQLNSVPQQFVHPQTMPQPSLQRYSPPQQQPVQGQTVPQSVESAGASTV